MLRSELVLSGRRPASWMGFRRKSRMRSPSMSITGRARRALDFDISRRVMVGGWWPRRGRSLVSFLLHGLLNSGLVSFWAPEGGPLEFLRRILKFRNFAMVFLDSKLGLYCLWLNI